MRKAASLGKTVFVVHCVLTSKRYIDMIHHRISRYYRALYFLATVGALLWSTGYTLAAAPASPKNFRILGTSPGVILPPAAASVGYTTLALNDDFNGPGLDEAVWSVGVPMTEFEYNGTTYFTTWNQELAYMTASQVRVQDSALILTAAQSAPINGPAGTRNFVSGNVSSYWKFSKQFYYVEIRAKLPTVTGSSTGLWDALWLYDTEWEGNEIDIMESYGGDQTNADGHIWAPANRDTGSPELSADYEGLSGWNIYGVLKTPSAIKFYLNNELRYTCTDPAYIESDSPPQAIMMELKLGDVGWMPPANPSQWGGGVQGPQTADLMIDWVHVWTP